MSHFLAKPFHVRLLELRERAGLTQAELGLRAGLHWNAVAQFEGARRRPSHDNLIKLADALDVSLDELCAREKFPEKNGRRT